MTVTVRVLYVDDEPDLLAIGKLYLEQSGDFAVTTLMSAAEGIRLLEGGNFDAIISDYQMPGMDGIRFLVEVRSRFGQIPFILFTGRGREEVVINAINSGADFYLQKGGDPVAQFAELSHKIRQSVGKYRAEKQIKLSEEKFSAAFAISPDPVAITDVKSSAIISANPAFTAWSGYSLEELIGKTTKDLNFWLNPHDRNEIIASLQAHENVINKSIKFRIKNGDIRDCQFSAQFISIDGEEYLFTRAHDVTDIMRVNQALQESEERFRAIFANQRSGTLIIDPSDHRIIDVNPYLCSLVGLPKDQIVGKVCHRFICPAESGKCPITDLGQCVDNSERVLVAADGRKIPIIKTVVNAKFLDKEYLIENIHDITEHKRSEKALQENEKRLNSIISVAPIGIGVTLNRIILQVNEQLCKMTGYSLDELMGKSGRLLYPSDKEYDYVGKDKYAQIARTGTGSVETKWQKKDGTIINVLLSSTPINPSDLSMGVTFTAVDITERKRLEEALLRSEGRYRTLAEESPDQIFINSRDGKIRYVNSAALKLFRLSYDQVVGKSREELFPPEIAKTQRTSIQKVFETEERIRSEDKIQFGSEELWIDTSLVPLKDASGTVTSVLGIARDITDRKKMEEALLHQSASLSILNAIITTANKADNLPQILDNILSESLRLLDFDAGGIYLVDRSTRTANVVYSKNLPKEFLAEIQTAPIDKKPYDTLFIQNEPIITENYAQIAPGRSKKFGFKSIASIPLLSKGVAIGALNLASTRKHVISDEEKQTLLTIGRELGSTIERMAAEEEAENTLKNFEILFNSIDEMVFVLDMQGRILVVNNTVLKRLSYTPEELTGTDVLLLHVPERRDEALRIVQGMIAGTIDSCPVPILAKDGTRIDVETKVTRGWWNNQEVLIGVTRDITERKRMEEVLKQSEEKYRNIFAAENDALLLVDDKTGFILEANNSACRLFGYSPEEFARLRNTDLSAEPEKTRQAIKEARTWIPLRYHKKKDGTIFPVEISISWFVLHDHNLHIAAIHDITERKMAEEKLKVSEEKYRTYIDNSPEGIFIVDAEGNYLDVNPSACSMLGYTREEFLSFTISDLLPPDHLKSSLSRFSKLKETGLLMSESVLVKKNGDLLPVILNATRLPDGKYLGFCSDIAKRKTIEAALHENEAFLREVITGANEGIIVYNRELQITLWNPFMEEMTGLKAEYVQGKLAVDIFPFIREKGIENLLKQALSGVISESNDFEYIISSTGKKGWVKGIYSPHYDSHHTIAGVIGIVQKVTERKRAEDALRKSEAKYRTLFEGATNPILIADEEGRYVDANAAALQFLETDKEELVRKTVWDYSPQRLIEEQRHEHGTFTEPRTLETVYSVHGKEKTLILNVLPVDMLGKRYVIGIGQDITERKRAEEALRESEEKFRLITDTIDEAFWMADVEIGKIFYVSPSFERIWGLSRESLYKNPRSFLDAVHKEDRERVLADLEIEKTGQPFDHEYRIVLPDGNIRNIWDRGFPIRDEKGQISIYAGIAIDITERKMAEEKLNEREEKYRTIFENAGDAIAIHDLKGQFIEVNDIFCRRFGYSREKLLTMTVGDVDDPVNARNIEARIQELIKKGHIVFETVHIARDGRQILTEASAVLFHLGDKPFVMSIARDITERKRVEEALRLANRKLNLLTSITRHDINNQLTVLIGYLTLIKTKQPDPALYEYFMKVSAAAQRISSMIQFTREYEAIGVSIPVWLDTRTLVDTASKQTPLGKVMVKNDLPAGTEVFADPLIGKVFYNLMDNAVRYGGKITTIRFLVEERDDNQIIVCEDDGDGVITEEKEKIFEKGYGKNTGMGLFLAREILEITGVTIGENGEPGKGARFEITVPKGARRSVMKDA